MILRVAFIREKVFTAIFWVSMYAIEFFSFYLFAGLLLTYLMRTLSFL